MPELPEVETVVRGLRRSVSGARVAAAQLRFPGLLAGEPALPLLPGRVIGSVDRAGKFILVGFIGAGGGASGNEAAPELRLLLHLGMSGKLLVLAAEAPLAPHTHFVLQLEDGREIRYIDPRRFGRLALGLAGANGGVSGDDPFAQAAAGREPLEIGPREFLALFWRRTGAIKSLLLKQDLLRGVGNIYADESLFRAGIHPRARRLSRPRLLRLRAALRATLRAAIAAGGSSIADYVSSDGAPGWFQVRHRVYGRQGQPCRRCGTPVRRIVVGGRGAHFCPRCQLR